MIKIVRRVLTGWLNRVGACAALLAIFSALTAHSQTPLIVGYVYQGERAIRPGSIDPFSMSRINFAFAKIVQGRLAEDTPADAANLAVLTALRRSNPQLKILISVGGWQGSAHFSDVALSEPSRQLFAESAMAFLRQHDLDGIDLDWEYPGQAGAGHRHRTADKQNFTLLLTALRQRFDREERRSHRHLLLTIAAGANQEYLDNTEMGKVQSVVDTVNLMTYDFADSASGDPSGHHAALYDTPGGPRGFSADAVVQAFEKAGVPAEKMVLGVPFYAHAWSEVSAENHGLFQRGKSSPLNNSTYAVVSKLPEQGFVRYWDETAQAPYLYSAAKRTVVSYDDPQSLALKCAYIRRHKLAGVMFWQLSGDAGGVLLRTLDEQFKPAGH
jgi:chitinase